VEEVEAAAGEALAGVLASFGGALRVRLVDVGIPTREQLLGAGVDRLAALPPCDGFLIELDQDAFASDLGREASRSEPSIAVCRSYCGGSVSTARACEADLGAYMNFPNRMMRAMTLH
jgi:hypothetical protein